MESANSKSGVTSPAVGTLAIPVPSSPSLPSWSNGTTTHDDPPLEDAYRIIRGVARLPRKCDTLYRISWLIWRASGLPHRIRMVKMWTICPSRSAWGMASLPASGSVLRVSCWVGVKGRGRQGSESLRVLSALQEAWFPRTAVRNPPWGAPGRVVVRENRKASGRSRRTQGRSGPSPGVSPAMRFSGGQTRRLRRRLTDSDRRC